MLPRPLLPQQPAVRRPAWLLISGVMCGAAHAVAVAPEPAGNAGGVGTPTPAVPAATSPAAPADTPPEAPPDVAPAVTPFVAPAGLRWEGALGPVFSYGPEYSGASRNALKVVPGFFLRYGRVTVSNTSAFVTRRSDDVFRGLGLDLTNNDQLRINVALRVDNGRRSKDSSALAGKDNVRATVRARASLLWQLDPAWKLGAAVSTDLLGKGGGQVADLSLGYARHLAPGLTWSVGLGLSAGSARYMRSVYGVTASESAASGYPVYTPGGGLRDVSIGTGGQIEINPQWTAFWGVGTSRLLGSTVASPLTVSPLGWGLNGGIARRF